MTVLCITTQTDLGLRPCTVAGEHGLLCPDRDINRAIAEHQGVEVPPPSCPGCLPRPAEVGHLCGYCFHLVEQAYMQWGEWRALAESARGRLVASEGGGSPDGYANLGAVFLAVDECERFLASRQDRTLSAWVETPEGAADAVRFAHAAHRAYRGLQVEERVRRVAREVCPSCGLVSPVFGHATEETRAGVRVTCRWCGFELAKVHTPRDPGMSDPCHADEHLTCDRLSCGCVCHEVGRRSTRAGIEALWDGDQHLAGFVDRAGWVIDGGKVRRAAGIEEGTAA